MTYIQNSLVALNFGSGGAMLPLQTAVAGTDPAAIRALAHNVMVRTTKIHALLAELESKDKELQGVWQGPASYAKTKTVTEGNRAFIASVRALLSGAHTVNGSGTAVQASQTGMNSVAGCEQLVAALLSNPFTHPQGVATATTAVGTLSKFYTALGTIFTALGNTQLGTVLTQLGTVAGGVDQLISAINGGGASPAPPAPPAPPPATMPPSPHAGYPYGPNGPGGYPPAYGPHGLPYGYSVDPATGSIVGTGYDPATGRAYGAGGGGDWAPVGGGSNGNVGGGSGVANGGGSGASGSTAGSDLTVVTVSSAGESVTFEIAANDPTTITAAVGSDKSPSEVSITVKPAA